MATASPLLGAAGASSLAYDSNGPRPPGPPGLPQLQRGGSFGSSSGFAGSGASLFGDQISGPGGAGGLPVANSQGNLHQKMLRQRQLALERQRNMSRNRFGGVAQANHQLPPVGAVPARGNANSFGRILGMCEGPPGTAGAGEKPAGTSSLRTAGAALMGATPAGAGNPAGTTGSNWASGGTGGSAEVSSAAAAAAAFDLGNDRLRTPAGSNVANSQKATPRTKSSFEELSIDGLEVMGLGDEPMLPMVRDRRSGVSDLPGVPPPGPHGAAALGDGPVSPSNAWGGPARMQRAPSRPGPDVVVETVGDFVAEFGDDAPRGGRRGGRERPIPEEEYELAPMAKKDGWDLRVESAREEVPLGPQGNAGGGGKRKNRWWNPFGGKGADESVEAIEPVQSFNPGADSTTQVCSFNPND